MLRKIKDLNIWEKYIIIILIVFMISFLINKFLFLPISSKADNNAWLQYWGGLIGALIAGLVTLWGIDYTIKSTLMNVKPFIRPISSQYYIYHKEGVGIAITDKDIISLMEEYYVDVEIETDPLEMLIVDVAYNAVLEEYKGSQWQEEIERIDFEYFKDQIIKLCRYETGENAFLALNRNIESLDNTGCNKDIIKRIINNMRQCYLQKIAHRVFHGKQMEWYKVVPVYNVGAGNAIDISFSWNFKDGSYKEILNKIGFNDEDYARINKCFSLDNIMLSKVDVLLNMNGENKVNIPIATELILLIKHIFIKRHNNKNANIATNDDMGIKYNKIADLHIECKDIYGGPNENNYSVLLTMNSGIGEKYGYTETYVNLKFEEY